MVRGTVGGAGGFEERRKGERYKLALPARSWHRRCTMGDLIERLEKLCEKWQLRVDLLEELRGEDDQFVKAISLFIREVREAVDCFVGDADRIIAMVANTPGEPGKRDP